MAFYDYRCDKCGREFEVSHGMTERPDVRCEECGSKAVKMPSVCGIVVHGGADRMRDSIVKRQEAKQDLLENYGVENVTPLQGATFDSVYRDIKASGSATKDKMQEEKALKAEASRKKRKEWAVKANQRVGERTRQASEKKAKEDAAKRAVRVSS